MTSTEIAAASKIMVGTTEAVAMYIGSMLIWQKSGGQQEHDYSLDYFTIESLEDNNSININRTGTSPGDKDMSYSLDGGRTWTNITLTSSVNITTINTGDKILFKGINSKLSSAWDKYWRFVPSKTFNVYGNAMSLLFGDNFINNSEFDSNSNHNLCGLFFGTTTLIDASNLILPATTLYESSYNGMFRGCSNLVNGPKVLPALDVPHDAYSSMFEGCVKLVEGPEILATTVSGNTALCRMFCMNRNRKVTAAMTKSPILRINNPGAYNNVYQQLFCGNGNITEVTVLCEGTGKSFASWLAYVSSTGVIKKLPTTTFVSGDSGVPSNWTTEDIELSS